MSTIISNKESVEYGLTVQMETILCYKCAIPFAVPQQLKEYLKKTQDVFYCPNGHNQCYTKSTETILKEKYEKIEREKEREILMLKNSIQWKEQTIEHQRKQNIVLKTKHTKFKNKLIHGVCPVDNCGRTFSNLYEHIKNQHPEFKLSINNS